MHEHFSKLGIQCVVHRFTGDNSYPEEYVLTWHDVEAVGPTYDLALVNFTEKLLKQSKAPLQRKLENAQREHRQWLNWLKQRKTTAQEQYQAIRQLLINDGEYTLLDPLDAMYNLLSVYQEALAPLQGSEEKNVEQQL